MSNLINPATGKRWTYAHRVNGRFAKIATAPSPEHPPMMPERALIKSSIYKANGALARFTGEYEAGLPVFRHHDKRFTSNSVETVSYEAVRAYMTGGHVHE